jgi:hypothetical protein
VNQNGIKNKIEEKMDNIQKVLEAMKSAGKPVSNSEIEKLTGLDKKEVEKAMKKLKADGLIISPKRCYWEPK